MIDLVLLCNTTSVMEYEANNEITATEVYCGSGQS